MTANQLAVLNETIVACHNVRAWCVIAKTSRAQGAAPTLIRIIGAGQFLDLATRMPNF